MRVAIVAEPYVPIPPNKYGGIEQVIYFLIKGLKEAGHEPILLGPGDSTVDCEILPIVPKTLSFPKAKREMLAHAQLVKKARRKTHKYLKELLPTIDIIHSHGFDLEPFKDFPHVITLHNKIAFDDSNPNYTTIDYLMKRKDLNYVSISNNQRAVCPELNYVGTVYNGEDFSKFPLVMDPEDYVCFLGRFDRDKSPHLAIQLAINQGIRIKLGGKIDYDSEGYFDEEIKKYLDHPLVEFLGELGFEEKIEMLSKAKCNLHPTNFREPFGLSVIEAAYCGTPTLAIARGSMPELIEPERTGILVEDFFEGRYLLDECFKMDRNYVATRARQLFNYQTMTEHYVEAYKRVIDTMPAYHHSTNTNFFTRFIKRVTPRETTITPPALPKVQRNARSLK